MWRSLEEDAILIGLDLNYFWSLNVNQYKKHVNVYNKKQKQAFQDTDYLNYILGKYISFAVNDPKHYPSKPVLQEQKQHNRIMTDEEMKKQIIHNHIRMGGVVK